MVGVAVLTSMNGSGSNIESVARDICARQLGRAGTSHDELQSEVDRYWHCIAAELEAGLIDETGNRPIPHCFDRDIEAYRYWRGRHKLDRTHQVAARPAGRS